MKFLVVDDNPAVRATVIEYLNTMGFSEFAEAENGAQAVQILGQGDIEFVISDWEMPEMSGIELLKLMKHNEAWSRIPFVMVTSPESQEKSKIEAAALSQVDAYIIKPFRLETLQVKIENILAKRDLERQAKGGVLVVDDDEAIRGTIVESVESMGYGPILQAENGEAALEILQQNIAAISMVLSDWDMPKMKGIELLRTIRTSTREKLAGVPFLMVTSQTNEEREKLSSAIHAEVDHYLMKPFLLADLKKAITIGFHNAKRRQDLKSLLEQADQAIKNRKPDEAEALFHRVMTSFPKDIRGYAGLATMKIRDKGRSSIDRAVQLIRMGINANPGADQGYVELAKLYEKIMSLGKAITTLREALVTCPNSPNVHYHLGRFSLRSGRTGEAIEHLRKAVELDPGYQDAVDLLNEAQSKK